MDGGFGKGRLGLPESAIREIPKRHHRDFKIHPTTSRGQLGLKEHHAAREGKALKGEPHKCYRCEIKPEGYGRSKSLGGCKTL
jgi:hypothetical protein